MILPPFWEYLSLYCSANLTSDFPGSRGRWSVLFVMLKGTWTAFQLKGLFEGNDTTNTLFAAEQANWHCYLKLRVKHLKPPKFLTWEKQRSPGFLHTFCLDLWVSTVFWSVSSRARKNFVQKKLSVLSDINLTFVTAIYWFTCCDWWDIKWWMFNGEHSIETPWQLVKVTAKYLMFQSNQSVWEHPFLCPCICFFSHPLWRNSWESLSGPWPWLWQL